MPHLWSKAPLLGTVAGVLLVAAACDRFEPEQLIPSRFAFEQGAHENVSCESCHPDDPATATIITCTGTAPAWDGVGCLQCHECDRGLHPNGAAHFPGEDCVSCHALSDPDWPTASGGGTVTGGEQNCSGACHGVARADAAPLGDAHAAHLDASTLWNTPGVCDMCHPAGGLTSPVHDDGNIDLPFGLISIADPKAPPQYTGGTCSGTYCHGSTLPEGDAAPSWTGGAAEAGCGTCHGTPPDSPNHNPAYTDCTICHAPTGGSQGGTIDDPSTHINGTIEAI